MRPSAIQFAPSRRLQDDRPCSRRSVYFSARDTRRQAIATTFSTSARNVRITWKVILLLWLALMVVLCLRANSQDSPQVSFSSPAGGSNQRINQIVGGDPGE
jgi:hypothetical protein